MKRYLGGLALGLVLLVTLLAAACSKGQESGEVREQLQAESLGAAAAMDSYEVQADGEVRQGNATAQFKLTYTFVSPDKVQWINESTFEGKTDKAGLRIIGQQRWSLDGETWTESTPLTRDIHNYSADQIWGLIPFVTAKAKGRVEEVNGFQAQRYTAERSGQGAKIELIGGSLLVTEETPFQGELTEFKMDYWTEVPAGFPVQMKLVASGGDRSVTVNARLTKANAASLSLAAPADFVPRQASGARQPAVRTTAPAPSTSGPEASAPAAAAAASTSAAESAAPTTAAVPPTPAPASIAPTTAPAAAVEPSSPPAPQTAAQQPVPTPAQAEPAASPPAAVGVAPPSTQADSGNEAPPAVVGAQTSAALPSAGSGGRLGAPANRGLAALGLAISLMGLALLAAQLAGRRSGYALVRDATGIADVRPGASEPPRGGAGPNHAEVNPAYLEIDRIRQSLLSLRASLSNEAAALQIWRPSHRAGKDRD